jgi:hypothetical protein
MPWRSRSVRHHVEAELAQHPGEIGLVIDRIGELGGITVIAVADDERHPAVERRLGRRLKRRGRRFQCGEPLLRRLDGRVAGDEVAARQRQHGFEVLDGAILVPQLFIRETTGRVRRHALRVAPDRLVEIGDSAACVAFETPSVAAVGVRPSREIGVEADRFVEIMDGAIEVALLLVREATAVERRDVARMQSDRLRVIADGTVMVAFAVVGGAAIEIGGDIVPVEPDCLIVIPGWRGRE